MPRTHLARIVHPAPAGSRTLGGLLGTWHYWWQAHYLDAIVDAGFRALRTGDRGGADQHAAWGDRLLQTIRLRNRVRWVNDFYDDMAWLALASGRLEDLHAELGRTARRRRLRSAGRHLTAQLRSAHTDDLGGGLFWPRDRARGPAPGPSRRDPRGTPARRLALRAPLVTGERTRAGRHTAARRRGGPRAGRVVLQPGHGACGPRDHR